MSNLANAMNKLEQLLNQEFGDSPRTCSLATTDVKNRPTVRTMVVRNVSDTGGLMFVSDRRTHKDDHLRTRPDCEVCFWLAKLNVQVRVRGLAVVVDAMNDHGLRQQWWDKMDPRGVLIFSGQDGSPLDIDMPATFELITVTPTWVEFGDFSTVPANVEHVEGAL
jgi:pyridoxine/pyridoxamine 5'-phosphate oxidase